MALALADKPYQLISPSHRQTASALANGTLVPLAACPAGQGRCAGRRSGRHTQCCPETHSSTACGHRSALGGVTHGSQIDPRTRMPTAQFTDTGTQRPTAPLLCVSTGTGSSVYTDSWKHPLPITSSSVTLISQMHKGHTSNSSAAPALPPSRVQRVASETATHNTQTRRDPQNRDYTQSIQDPQEEADRLIVSALQTSLPQCSQMPTDTHGHSAQRTHSHHQLPRKPPVQRCPLPRQLGHTSHLGKRFPGFWRQSTLSLGRRSPRALSLSLGSWDGAPATVLNLLVGTSEVQELAFLAPNPRSFLG